ncbi:unnamed protein product [Brassica rapa subsp. trilocularis]
MNLKIKAGKYGVNRNHRLPETEAGQDSALRATTCQSHSPTIGSQAPVTNPTSLTEPLFF